LIAAAYASAHASGEPAPSPSSFGSFEVLTSPPAGLAEIARCSLRVL
jgi:hypothetical protein